MKDMPLESRSLTPGLEVPSIPKFQNIILITISSSISLIFCTVVISASRLCRVPNGKFLYFLLDSAHFEPPSRRVRCHSFADPSCTFYYSGKFSRNTRSHLRRPETQDQPRFHNLPSNPHTEVALFFSIMCCTGPAWKREVVPDHKVRHSISVSHDCAHNRS
jgi:hypothetical protein